MTDYEDAIDGSQQASGPTRRTLMQAAGWSVPVLAAAVAAPAARASETPTFEGIVGTWSTPARRADGTVATTFTMVNTSAVVHELDGVLIEATPDSSDQNVVFVLGVPGGGSGPDRALDDQGTDGQVASATYRFRQNQGATITLYINVGSWRRATFTARPYRPVSAPTQFSSLTIP